MIIAGIKNVVNRLLVLFGLKKCRRISSLVNLKTESFRAELMRIEKGLADLPPAIGLKETHHFSSGVYARELFIPEGTMLTGKIHKFENLNVLSQGEISVVTEEGVKRIKAPATIVSNPGTKRLGYAHTDCVWICFHATEETDVDKIEEQVIAKDYDEVEYLATTKEIKELKGVS